MSAQHTIQVEFPGEAGGPHTIVIGQSMFDQIRILVLQEQLRKAEEAARRASESFTWANSTFTFTTQAQPGDESIFDRFFSDGASEFHAYPHARRNGKTATPPKPPDPGQPMHPITVTDALAVIGHYTSWDSHQIIPPADDLRRAVRRAKRHAHPDTGGTATDFQRVTAAEQILRTANRI